MFESLADGDTGGNWEGRAKRSMDRLIGVYITRNFCQWGVVVASPTVTQLKFNQHRVIDTADRGPGGRLGLGLVIDALDGVADQSDRVVLTDGCESEGIVLRREERDRRRQVVKPRCMVTE